jgi:flagellar assembly factor FliW
MRELQTPRFGLVRYDENEVFRFPVGLPGFESETEFLLIENDASRPLCFLQSTRTPELCFICAPTAVVDPQYAASSSKADLETLQTGKGEESPMLDWLAILCFAQPEAPTANLLGPVVLRRDLRLGVQSIREDNRYSARHPLFGEMMDAGEVA